MQTGNFEVILQVYIYTGRCIRTKINMHGRTEKNKHASKFVKGRKMGNF